MRTATFGAIALLAAGCASGPLPYPEPLDRYPSNDTDQRAKLDAAWTELQRRPDDRDCAIWYGRRTAYLRAYDRAIEVYTAALSRHPKSPHLLRHRGHRYITIGEYGLAVVDLRNAARYIEGQADEVEPDGLPNARNFPTSTLHTNVWYHLGLAHYLRRDFAEAERCYDACLAAAKNRDMEVATRYWLYLTRRRRNLDGSDVLEPVRADWDIIENHAYHKLLLLFRGELTMDAFASEEPGSVTSGTAGYGIARYHFDRGRSDLGVQQLESVVAAGPAAAFGCIAAREDLRRLGR